MTKKPIIAAELMARLNANPEWVAARAREENERQQREGEYRRAEVPLVEELQKAGFDVKSAWDLVNTSAPYPNALPILLEHLQRPYPGPVREGIARALAVPPAKFGWKVLTTLFRKEQNKRAKNGLAVAIGVTADDTVIDEAISLARDRQQGSSRVLLLCALERSKVPSAYQALLELQNDPELCVEVRNILRRLKK